MQTTVNVVGKDDSRSHLLYGTSIGIPLDRSQSLQFGYMRRDAMVDVANSSHNFVVGWSIRFSAKEHAKPTARSFEGLQP